MIYLVFYSISQNSSLDVRDVRCSFSSRQAAYRYAKQMAYVEFEWTKKFYKYVSFRDESDEETANYFIEYLDSDDTIHVVRFGVQPIKFFSNEL